MEEGRLHVRPALLMTIHTRVEVEMEDLDRAADTQQQIADRMERLIGEQWRSRPIGSQIALGEVWRTVRETPNVRLVRQVLVEGTYVKGGRPASFPWKTGQSCPLPWCAAAATWCGCDDQRIKEGCAHAGAP